MDWLPLLCIAIITLLLIGGFPVGSALIIGSLGTAFLTSLMGCFDLSLLTLLPNRLFGMMSNETLLAIPLFIFMGILLEKSKLAKDWLQALGVLLKSLPGASLLAILAAGALMGASTGIVGASVMTLSILAMPRLKGQNESTSLSAGLIAASGTLGQLIPPSIVLILLADVVGHAHSEAQLSQGNYAFEPISVGDVFVAAFLPGALLVFAYAIYVVVRSFGKVCESKDRSLSHSSPMITLLPGMGLAGLVLGSIFSGLATPTEAASMGVLGAMFFMAWKQPFSWRNLISSCKETAILNGMVFYILIGASLFSLVFRGLSGDEWVHHQLAQIPGGVDGQLLAILLMVFFLGFILDFIEITLIIIPLVGPSILSQGIDPLWFTILVALNLQTSFLTPPFGFSLFYLKGAAPWLDSKTIYTGVIPFVLIQLGVLMLIYLFPQLIIQTH